MKTKFYAAAHFLLAWLVRVIFLIFTVDRKNEPTLKEGNYLLVSNHISALDPVFICAALRRQQPRFMAKAELFRNPASSAILGAVGAYPIDRSGANAGVLKKTVNMLENGFSVGMFPQGTRRPGVDPASTPVKNGVGLICEHSRATVLPVFIKVKGNKTGFLRPIRIIIGEAVTYDEYTANGEFAKDTAHITACLFDKVCKLGGTETEETDGQK